MIEFFKLLIEEPEKRKKLLLFSIRLVLNIIFASHLYTWAIGKYSIINIIDVYAWIEFVKSGRVLICVLLYFTSDKILFGFFEIFTVGLLHFLSKKVVVKFYFGRDEKSIIFRVLNMFELITFDKKTNKIKAGKNTDEFYEVIESFTKQETKKEIKSIKNSLVSDLVHTFFVFVFLFYLFINIETQNSFINWIIILCCIFLPVIYIIASKLFDFLHANAKDILQTLHSFKIEKLINDTLKDMSIYISEVENPKELGYEKTIYHGGQELIILYNYGKLLLNNISTEHVQKLYAKTNKKMILISNKELSRNASIQAEGCKEILTIIVFGDESDLVSKLENHFKEK